MEFSINTTTGVPIYEQLAGQICTAIARGRLHADERLPSVRELSQTLVVNPNTVARAYRELEQEGLIYTQKGRGSFLTARRVQDVDRDLGVHLNRKMDETVREIKKFGLSPAEIRKLFEDSLRRSEEKGRRGGGDE